MKLKNLLLNESLDTSDDMSISLDIYNLRALINEKIYKMKIKLIKIAGKEGMGKDFGRKEIKQLYDLLGDKINNPRYNSIVKNIEGFERWIQKISWKDIKPGRRT